MKLRHPNILPPLVIEVRKDAVEAHLAAGWKHVNPPRPAKRAASESPKETAHE